MTLLVTLLLTYPTASPATAPAPEVKRQAEHPAYESPVEGGQVTFCCTYGVSRTGPTRP